MLKNNEQLKEELNDNLRKLPLQSNCGYHGVIVEDCPKCQRDNETMRVYNGVKDICVDFFLSQRKEDIEAIVEMIESKKVGCELCENREVHDTNPVNKVIDDIVSYLKEKLFVENL